MLLSLGQQDLATYVIRQLDHFFPDGRAASEIADGLEAVLDRVERCFRAIDNKYFRVDAQARFNHLHSDQYAMFLYLLANTLYRRGVDQRLCDKVYCLNKALHGIDVYYEVELPDIFLFGHAVGTVLGRARYANHFLIQQNCTVGASREARPGEQAEFPVIGEYVAIYAGASVLGKCQIGDNCKIAAHSAVLDQDLAANTIYIGTRASHVLKVNQSHDNIWAASD